MAKNQKWLKWLEFESIRIYLNGSIGSKSDVIGDNLTLEDKVKNVNLGQSLTGISIFLNEYSEMFNYPQEIIAHYNDIRTSSKDIAEFKKHIEDFTIWLKNEKLRMRGRDAAPKEVRDLVGKIPYSEIAAKFEILDAWKGVSPGTAINYQAQLRGFLSWNDINLKFKNYDEMSETAKEHDKYDIKYDELFEMGKLVIDYAPDLDLRLLLRWLRNSGLGSKEVLLYQMKDLRHKNWKKSKVRIDKVRKKTGVKYTSFLKGDFKDDIEKYINNEENRAKAEDDWLFDAGLSRSRAYNNLERRFKRAYERMIDEHYPQLKDAERSIFTMHKYRHLIQTLCESLRIPKYIEDRLVAHKSEKLEKRYLVEKDIGEYYDMIYDAIHGYTESSTREEIKEEIRQEIMDALFNRGAAKSEYKKSKTLTPEQIEKLNSNIKTQIMVEELISVAKNELLTDDSFILSLAERISNLSKF